MSSKKVEEKKTKSPLKPVKEEVQVCPTPPDSQEFDHGDVEETYDGLTQKTADEENNM